MGLLNTIKDTVTKVVAPAPALKATMMGPRAVGKTSVMASIFSETRDSVAGTGLYFRPSPKTGADLTKKKLLLQSIIENRKTIQDIPQTGAIEASSEEIIFAFEMGRAGRAKTVDILIRDFPGEYLTFKPDMVSQFISESNIIMVAIDTPYLMEENGRYNEDKNEVTQVTKFFRDNSELIKDKMILLIPLKCERYFHDNRLKEMTQRVKIAYADLIAFCHETNIACVITPIQTLGFVEFDHFVDNTTGIGTISKLSLFCYYGQEPKFMPMFCTQPLFYLLTYVGNQYEWMSKQSSNILSSMRNTLVSFLKDDDEFFHEIKKISKNIIHDQFGYEIVASNTIFKLK